MAWLIVASVLFVVAGLLVLYFRRRRSHGSLRCEPWTRQDGLAAASLLSGVLLGVLTLVLPFLMTGGNANDPRSSDSAGLELVDLAVLDESEEDPGPGIDFKLRNTGSEVSFLTEITLTIIYHGELVICEPGGYKLSSYSYDLDLPINPVIGQQVIVRISQEIRPNHTDRFIARVGLESFTEDPTDASGLPVGFEVYIVEVELSHDGSRTLEGGDAVLIVPVKAEYGGGEDYSGYLLDEPDPCYNHNRAVIDQVLRAEGAALSPKLTASVP